MRHLIAALALLSVVAVGVSGCSGTPQSPQATSPTTSSHEPMTASSAPTPASAQTVLPLTGLENPQDVAVDAAATCMSPTYINSRTTTGFPTRPRE